MDQDDTKAIINKTISRLKKQFHEDISSASIFETHASKGIPLTTLCGNSVNRFSIYLRLLQIIKSCLDKDKITTKRDIYYDAVNLFKTQGVVDSCIARITNDFCKYLVTLSMWWQLKRDSFIRHAIQR